MAYGSLSLFYGGLESLIGPPHMVEGSMLNSMADEHRRGKDATKPFTSANGVTSTSADEYGFVVEPDAAREYPERAGLAPEQASAPCNRHVTAM